jgi:hypothetical protein
MSIFLLNRLHIIIPAIYGMLCRLSTVMTQGSQALCRALALVVSLDPPPAESDAQQTTCNSGERNERLRFRPSCRADSKGRCDAVAVSAGLPVQECKHRGPD